MRWGPTQMFDKDTLATVLRLDKDGDADLRLDGCPDLDWWSHSSDAQQWQVEGAADENVKTFTVGNRIKALFKHGLYVARIGKGVSGRVIDVESSGDLRVVFEGISSSVPIEHKELGALQVSRDSE